MQCTLCRIFTGKTVPVNVMQYYLVVVYLNYIMAFSAEIYQCWFGIVLTTVSLQERYVCLSINCIPPSIRLKTLTFVDVPMLRNKANPYYTSLYYTCTRTTSVLHLSLTVIKIQCTSKSNIASKTDYTYRKRALLIQHVVTVIILRDYIYIYIYICTLLNLCNNVYIVAACTYLSDVLQSCMCTTPINHMSEM